MELWRKTQVTDERAKLIFYNAFIDGALDAPRSLLPEGLFLPGEMKLLIRAAISWLKVVPGAMIAVR